MTNGLTNIEEDSIEAFLAHGDIPDQIYNCSISSRKYNSKFESQKVANLDMSLDLIYIMGNDEAWVLGKFHQLETFLNKKIDLLDSEKKNEGTTNGKSKGINQKFNNIPKITELEHNCETIEKNIDRVFVVHGHDEEMKQSVARVLHSLELEPIILNEKPNEIGVTQLNFTMLIY
jgi:hypothetical protein